MSTMSTMSLMTVRASARGLGVHENTIRRWEEKGLIRAVRLPSGVRRFRSEDVLALRRQMFTGFPDVVEEELPPIRKLKAVED
jgi:excisionase family DNA binding protein